MFSQPTTAPPTFPVPSSPTSPTTSRTGRLRGLSYLRSYTHNHLISHSSQHSNSPSHRNSLQRSTSSSAQTSSDHSSVEGSAENTQEQQATQAAQAATTEEAASNQTESQTASGWLPTVGGSSGLSSAALQPQSIPPAAATSSVPANDHVTSPIDNANIVAAMTRHRSDSTPSRSRLASMLPSPTFRTEALNFGRLLSTAEGEPAANHGSTPSQDTNGQTSSSANPQLPTIRFIPHQDPRSARPSLAFPPISRTLPDSSSVIKVGRYSERDTNPSPAPNTPSAALVGFKSKVVSRKHCEFWCSKGQWYVKDVKSSSGTFLNHIRLSQPNVESRPYPVNDGDVVQLGIDFRGGEEMIFRCVKIRVECNRAWQKGLNSFNMSTHKRLRNLAKLAPSKDSDAASTHTSECSICLMSVAPCQSLFVAPCSHVWHYKCIRPILNDHRTWPQFLCPNCRAVADLEADVDDPYDYEEQSDDEAHDSPDTTGTGNPKPNAEHGSIGTPNGIEVAQPADGLPVQRNADPSGSEAELPTRGNTASLETLEQPTTAELDSSSSLLSRRIVSGTSMLQRGIKATRPTDRTPPSPRVPSSPSISHEGDNTRQSEPSNTLRVVTPTPGESPGPEGPMTPRNDAGPFVFDGSAGRASGRRVVASLAEAAAEDEVGRSTGT